MNIKAELALFKINIKKRDYELNKFYREKYSQQYKVIFYFGQYWKYQVLDYAPSQYTMSTDVRCRAGRQGNKQRFDSTLGKSRKAEDFKSLYRIASIKSTIDFLGNETRCAINKTKI